MSIYHFFLRIHIAIRSFWWCVFHNAKYTKGLDIGKHVKITRGTKVEFKEKSRIAYNTLLWGGGLIKIGKNTSIGSNSRIFASTEGGVTIGDNVNVASHLYIIDCDHGTKAGIPLHGQPMIVKPVKIENDIWFGYHVTVLKGVTIHSGSVLGACSVVTKDVPRNAIMAGSPARIIKYRE